jgi:hypothetical protein
VLWVCHRCHPSGISGVMISVLTSSEVDCGFKPWSVKTKDYKRGICCFSTEHAAVITSSRKKCTLTKQRQVIFSSPGLVITFRPSSVVRPSTFHILIFSSETTGPIATKLWWNDPWMAPFQNCVRWSRLPIKMATKLKIEKRGVKFFKNLLLCNYWANLNQTLLKWSLGGPLPNYVWHFRPPTEMAATAKLNLT